MTFPSLPRLRRSLAAGLVACAATGAALVATTDARAAGGYIHQSCVDGADLSDAYGGWSSHVYSVPGNGNDIQCPWGGLHSVMDSATTMPFGATVGWLYTAPADTTISRFDTAYAGWTQPFGGQYRGVIQAVDSHGYIGLNYTDNGADAAHHRELDWAGLNATAIDVRTLCDGPAGQPGCNGQVAWSSFYYPKIYLSDDAPPVAGAASGSLTSDPALKGNEVLSYSATDQGGGVARLRLYVDGALAVVDHVIDDFNGHCQVKTAEGSTWVFSFPKPCPGSVNTAETIDTRGIPDGSHTLTAKVVDAGQREATLWTGTKVVANHPPVSTAPPSYANAANAASPIVGLKLTANDGAWAGPSLSYARGWQQCDGSGLNCAQIADASTVDYTPTPADIGHRLRFAVTATNAADSVTTFSPATGVVAAPSSADPPTVKPDPAAGTNGSNGSNGGGGTTTIVIPTLTTTSTDHASHTLIGRVVGEREGVACPNDKATLKFQHISGGRMKLGFGKSGAAQVQLTCTDSGKAIAGAKLEIATKTGAQAAVAADVTTDGAGHATLRLAKGGSRGITVGYRMYADDPMARATATLRVLVTAKVSLSANRQRLSNGQAVRLKGALAGGLVPKRGVNLAVQWRDGKRWRPFAQIKTDAKGRFRYAYTFTRTNRTVVYRLRVQVAQGQIDYPFVAAPSRLVRVTVAR